jgi:cation transport regulator ChaB
MADLPDSIKDALSGDDQKLYIETFNAALTQHSSDQDEDTQGLERRETAHRMAWATVKR